MEMPLEARIIKLSLSYFGLMVEEDRNDINQYDYKNNKTDRSHQRRISSDLKILRSI